MMNFSTSEVDPMLTIIEKTANTATVEFSGEHLKKWYAEYGNEFCFICRVIGYVFREQQNIASRKLYKPNSAFVVNEFRNLFPKRFKKPVAWEDSIGYSLKSKYSGGKGGKPGCYSDPIRSRSNMIKLIPDDHIFTWVLNQ